MERDIEWTGEPISYRRRTGFGLVIGRHQYLFDIEGRLQSMQPITRTVLASLLSALYPDHVTAMAAKVRVVTHPSIYAKEGTNNE